MKLTLGQLRTKLLVEMKKDVDGSIIIDADDLGESLAERAQKNSKVRGVDFFVPFRFKDNFDPGQFGSDQQRAAMARALKINPKDVLAVLKHSPITTASRVTLKTTERAINSVIRMMVSAIARRHADLGINVVTHPQSSSDMARMLAQGVADELGVKDELEVPMFSAVTRKKTADELEIDEDVFNEFAQEALADGRGQEYVDKTRKDIEKLITQWQKSSETPATKKLLHRWRKFLVLHAPGQDIDKVAGRVVLVVDDNVDKAETFKGIEKILKNAGAREVYNAAGWDYSARQ